MSDESEFFKYARETMLPQMKASRIAIAIAEDPDPQICMQIGAMVLFDKPIICIVPAGQKVSANLRRVASVIVQGDMKDPTTKERLQRAIENVMKNDKRVQ